MPRFNFSAFVEKNKLAEFSDNLDIHPQEEWEAGKKAEIPAKNLSELSVSSRDNSAHSTTSTAAVEKTLQDEIDDLTKELNEVDDGILARLDNQDKSAGDKAETQSINSGFRTSVALDETLFHVDGEENLATNARNVSLTSQMEPVDEFEPPSASTPPPPEVSEVLPESNHQILNQTHDMSVCFGPNQTSTCEETNATYLRENTTLPPDGTFENVSGQLIMAMDNVGRLQPVSRRAELEGITRSFIDDAIPPSPREIGAAVEKFRNIPITYIYHYSTLGEYLHHLYANEQITDVHVRIGTHCFAAHRVALSCFSEYFAELFLKKEGKIRVPIDIRLRGIRPEAFKSFMDYIYTGKMKITTDIIGDLMIMSDQLRIPKLKPVCTEYAEHIPIDHALVLLDKGGLKPESEMFGYAFNCVSRYFSDLAKRKCFLELDIQTLCLILSHDYLEINSEMDVFKAGLSWLLYLANERERFLEQVMGCVRFCYMKPEELFECARVTDLIKTNEVCTLMLLKANWVIAARNLKQEDPFHFATMSVRHCFSRLFNRTSDIFYSATSMSTVTVEVTNDADSLPASPRETKPRKQTSKGEILAVGGFETVQDGRDTKEVSGKMIERYMLEENQWKHCSNLPEPRFHHAATTLHGKLYISGGTDPSKSTPTKAIATNTAFVMNLETNTWKQIAPMNSTRMHHRLCSMYGMVYAVGGLDDNNRVLKSVECYNPLTDNWFYVKDLTVGRIGAGVAVLDGKMYVAGGYGEPLDNRSGRPMLSSVECFDPRTNSWTVKKDLPFPRGHTSLVAADGQMYIVGGITQNFKGQIVSTSSSSIDIYNQELDVWEHKTAMVVPRHNAGVTVMDGKIYIVGGMSTVTDSIMKSIECYDITSNAWISGVQELPYPAKWLCCVAVPEKYL